MYMNKMLHVILNITDTIRTERKKMMAACSSHIQTQFPVVCSRGCQKLPGDQMVVVFFQTVTLTFKPSHQNINTHARTHTAHIKFSENTCNLAIVQCVAILLFHDGTVVTATQNVFSLFPMFFLFYYFYFSPLPLAPHSPLLLFISSSPSKII